MCSIQYYVIKFVSDFRQVGGFLWVLRFSFTNKTYRHDITVILLKVELNILTHYTFRGYYIRATAIDYILNKFLSSTSSKKQILSLGAGFDSAYFRLKSDERIDDVVFCEIDFPDVVKRKHTVISKNTKLNNLIPGYFTQSEKEDPLIEINTEGYKLLGVDLTQHNTLEALLKLCGVDFDLPTLLLSECVLTYMTKRW